MVERMHSTNSENSQFRPWREIAIFMVMLMEVSWVTLWVRMLVPDIHSLPISYTYFVFLGIIATSHIIARLMEFFRLKVTIRRILAVGILLASTVATLRIFLFQQETLGLVELLDQFIQHMTEFQTLFPSEFIVVLVTLLGWWRGISLAREHIEPSSVMGYFRLGFVMFLVYVVFNTSASVERPERLFYLFLFCGLIAMATARIFGLRSVRGGRLNTFDRKWLGEIIFAALSIVIIAVGLTHLMDSSFSWIRILIMGGVGVLVFLVWAILTPIFYLLIFVVEKMEGFTEGMEVLGETFDNLQIVMQQLVEQASSMISKPDIMVILMRVLSFLRAFFLWGMILLVGVGVITWIVGRFWRDQVYSQGKEDQQSILSGNEVWRLLRKYFQRMITNLWEGARATFDIKKRIRTRAAIRIRQIYADLLDLGEQLQCVRRDTQTPLEYLPILQNCLKEVDNDLELITHAYIRVRYGQFPENKSEVEMIEVAWRNVTNVSKDKLAALEQKKIPQHLR